MNTDSLTELEAVNTMLRTIGEQPVNNLELSGVMEVSAAREQLRAASHYVQAKGWHFNTNKRMRLAPDRDGFINLPANCLRVDTVGRSGRIDVVKRGSRLYDRVANSFVFKNAVVVDMVINLDFDELTEDAKKYVIARATRRFQEGVVASQVLEEFTRQDEFEAKVDLESAESENADYNILTDNYPNIRTMARRW